MKCPACDKRLEGKQCACGWKDPSITPTNGIRHTCSWKTESRVCAFIATAEGLCSWHRNWLRLIDHGTTGRTDKEEFIEWWEQFQPTGCYGQSPGPWWAHVDVLWQALRGHGLVPVLTEQLSRELYLRRSEVLRFERGLTDPMTAPWARITALPLPPWDPAVWQAKVAARMALRKADAESSKQRIKPAAVTL